MVDFKQMSLDEMQKKGLIDFQTKIDPSKLSKPNNSGSIMGNLSPAVKGILLALVLLLLFGLYNVPVYIWYFFYK